MASKDFACNVKKNASEKKSTMRDWTDELTVLAYFRHTFIYVIIELVAFLSTAQMEHPVSHINRDIRT